MQGLSSFLSTQLSRKHFHRSGQTNSLTTLEYKPGSSQLVNDLYRASWRITYNQQEGSIFFGQNLPPPKSQKASHYMTAFKHFCRGNKSICLHRSGPLLENDLDRPENRYGRYGFASSSSISISTVGLDGARVSLWRFSFLALWVVVVVVVDVFISLFWHHVMW